jgi:lipopolysaccharide assembly outer membrane protein LptD (OstA)
MTKRPRPPRHLLHAATLATCALVASTLPVNAALEAPIIPTVNPTLSPTSAIPVNLEIRADSTSVWRSDLEQRMLAQGRVVIEIGYRTLHADNAAIWLTPSKESGESTLDVAIYLSGNVRVAEGNHAYSTNSTATELLVTTRISRNVQLAGTPTSKSEEDSPFVKRGNEIRQQLLNRPLAPVHIPHIVITSAEQALQSGWIARGPNNKIIAGPGELQVTRGPNGEVITPAPKPKPKPEILATGDINEGQEVGDERITIIHGAYLLANRRDGTPPIEFHSQRMILFSPKDTEGSTTKPAGNDPAAELATRITGAYLEGDVSLDTGTQSVRAKALYYDFTSQRAIMLDATLSTIDEKRKIPLYMRAKEIRMLSRSEFAAKKATFSTSEFNTPHYHIGASNVYLQDITPRDENGKAAGLQTYAFKAKDGTINIQGVPVFYWPYLAGDTAKNEIPLRRLKVSNSSTYGLSLQTDWDIFALAGQKEPEGVTANLQLDYFGKRGPGGGVDATWHNDDYSGLLRSYIMTDRGTDRLGADRKDIPVSDDVRGRIIARHRQELGDGWSLSLEGGYVSDPNFLEQFFPTEFDTDKEPETSAYLKKQGETDALTFLGKFSLMDFTVTADKMDDQYVTDKYPEIKYWRIGDSFLDMLTYYSESSASYLHTNITDFTPGQRGLSPGIIGPPGSFAAFTTTYRDRYKQLGWTTNNVLRGDTRQEIDAPFQIGDLKITPYVTGRVTAWDDAFPAEESGDTVRLWGQVGLRASMAFWKVYDDVHSTFFDVHRIRHLIEPQFYVFGTGSTENRGDLQAFDPDVEGISRASGFSLSLNQKWQTKRGGEGHWRNVDWIVFNVHINQFWNEDKPTVLFPLDPLRGFLFPSRPELSLVRDSVSLDGVWRVGERARLMGEMNYNTEDGRLEQFATGLAIDQTNNLSYFVGNRYVRELSTNEITFGIDYQLTRKYQVILSESYDTEINHNILSSLTLIRRLPRFNTAITLTYDANQDDTTVVFTAWPEGFPDIGFGNRAAMAGAGR